MKISEIKKKMKNWTDSLGFDISNDIDGAKNKEELSVILQHHTRFLQDVCYEACQSTENFVKELGLDL